MSAEIETYVHELRWTLDQVARVVDGCPAQLLDWRPSTGAANSAWATAKHVAECTRVYVLGFGCGQEVKRDRAAEFAAVATDARTLTAEIRQLSEEIASALAALPAPALDWRLTPPPHLWGTGEPREISAREAIVEAIRHAGIHLGELRLTRDLAGRSGA